jgi:hypothetical protein
MRSQDLVAPFLGPYLRFLLYGKPGTSCLPRVIALLNLVGLRILRLEGSALLSSERIGVTQKGAQSEQARVCREDWHVQGRKLR